MLLRLLDVTSAREGAQTLCGVIDSLTKKDRKKTSNYINAKSIGSAHCPQCFLRIIILGISFSSLKESVFIRLRLTLFKYFLVCQEIQESDSQYSEFVFLAVDIITYNDNLTEVVID